MLPPVLLRHYAEHYIEFAALAPYLPREVAYQCNWEIAQYLGFVTCDWSQRDRIYDAVTAELYDQARAA